MKRGQIAGIILMIIIGSMLVYVRKRSHFTDTSGTIPAYTTPTATPVTQVTPTTPAPETDSPKTTCQDVTSYDYNWDNDMFCTRPDGSTFYTSYQGAEEAEQ